MPKSAFGPHLMTAPITGKTHRTATFLLLLVELFVSLYPSCLAFPNLQITYASRINNGTQRKFQIILDCVSRSKRSPQYNLPIQSLKRCATLDVLLCNWTNSKYKRGGFSGPFCPVLILQYQPYCNLRQERDEVAYFASSGTLAPNLLSCSKPPSSL